MHLNQTESAGIYVHIPFCIQKCPYCDFFSITDQSLKQPFIEALLREMDMTGNVPFFFDTLYIGGGTPSVFKAGDIGQLIKAAHRFFKISANAEITIEVNPGTVNPEQLTSYQGLGINRISIGVQSFDDRALNFLGRIHSGKDANLAVKWAREAGFENVGLDLIYGIPGQTKRSWLFDLQRAVEFEPEHLSCYMLTYEAGTPMDKDRQKGSFCTLSESLVSDLFETTIEFLNTHGYVQYEISNFARSGSGGFEPKSSRHNRKYWSFAPYLGFGPSAHSFIEPARYWNCRSVKKYIKEIEAGMLPLEEKEVLSREQCMIEAIYLGLRKRDGICIDAFDRKFDTSFNRIFGETITYLEKKKFLKVAQNRCALTLQGMLFLDSIASMFISQEFSGIIRKN